MSNDLDLIISDNEKQFLINLTQDVIKARLTDQEFHIPPSPSESLNQNFGVFVTLHRAGELRGCIGYVEGIRPLIEAVAEMAEAAAFRDPRFEPVNHDELGSLEIEISILSPLQKIKSVEEIIVGKHGLLIRRGFTSGLLLPQVAIEYNWDRETFLQHTCMKAGLPVDAWEDPKTTMQIFSAEIFSSVKKTS